MKVLVAIYPFLTQPECEDIDFIINPWGHSASADEIEEEIVSGAYDGLIVGTREVRNSIIDRANSLKVVSRVGVGYNNIDVEYFRDHGVTIAYTPFGPTDSTAEMTLGLILAGTRRLFTYDRMIRKGIWDREFSLRMKDAVVGIAGFGRIGKRLTTLLAPFGCKILLHDIKPDLATAHAWNLEFVEKEDLLARADIITIHMPLKTDTLDWLSYNELALLDRSVTIVNTARGGIINEQAIYQYLRDHPDSYYCCDVFEQEPYHGELTRLDNVLLTPHASSFTVGSRRQTELQAVDNCCRILRGQSCDFVVENNE